MRTLQYKVSYEDLISRIPALFAYLQEDEHGNMVLHMATDAKDGCYGKVVQNIKIPNSVSSKFVKHDEVVSYRSLMNFYYEHKTENDGLIRFVEKAIGIIPVEFYKEYMQCPTYVYASRVRSLYGLYSRKKKQCEFYKTLTQNTGEINPQGCCIREEYEQMGGDIMLNFLKEHLEDAENIAREYLSYVADDKGLTINFNLNLVSTSNDMGIVSVAMEEYDENNKYEEGDVVATINDGIVNTWKKTNNGDSATYDEDTFSFKPNFSTESWKNLDTDLYKTEQLEEVEEITSESLLQSLRRCRDYINLSGETERPSYGKDWLFYYRVNQPVNIKTSNDEHGNILLLHTSTTPTNEGSYEQLVMSDLYNKSEGEIQETIAKQCTQLCAYGDVITSIDVDKDNRVITIKYVIDAHLKATGYAYEIDKENHVVLCYYECFVYDDDEDSKYKSGIEYTETFIYDKNGEIEKLVNRVIKTIDQDGDDIICDFEEYVNGGYGNPFMDTYKFEFNTHPSGKTYQKRLGLYDTIEHDVQVATVQPVKSQPLNVTKKEGVYLFRHDYYQGISYSPTLDIDVLIDRGYTTVFQKHIKFSEVNTLEDMENGNFFKMTT